MNEASKKQSLVHLEARHLNGDYELLWHTYMQGQPALRIHSPSEGPMATASYCVPDFDLPKGHILLKGWRKNEGIPEALERAGIVSAPIEIVSYGNEIFSLHCIMDTTSPCYVPAMAQEASEWMERNPEACVDYEPVLKVLSGNLIAGKYEGFSIVDLDQTFAGLEDGEDCMLSITDQPVVNATFHGYERTGMALFTIHNNNTTEEDESIRDETDEFGINEGAEAEASRLQDEEEQKRRVSKIVNTKDGIEILMGISRLTTEIDILELRLKNLDDDWSAHLEHLEETRVRVLELMRMIADGPSNEIPF